MPKFAVYYVPPEESDLYRRGSEILGYDVRTGDFLPEDNATRAALPEFDPAWVTKPQTYGFHVTTGYSLYFEIERLPQIEGEIETVLNCFSADAQFTLTPDAENRIPFWRGTIAVLHCHPNPAMLMLHTMLTARVNPLGTGSNVSRRYADENPAALNPVLAHRTKHFYTPYMLDGWVPHFSLMYPYTGEKKEALHAVLLDLFPPDPIPVQSISLLLMQDDETHYRLHREFHFADFPQGFTGDGGG